MPFSCCNTKNVAITHFQYFVCSLAHVNGVGWHEIESIENARQNCGWLWSLWTLYAVQCAPFTRAVNKEHQQPCWRVDCIWCRTRRWLTLTCLERNCYITNEIRTCQSHLHFGFVLFCFVKLTLLPLSKNKEQNVPTHRMFTSYICNKL